MPLNFLLKMGYKVLFIHACSNNIAGQETALVNSILALKRVNVDCQVLLKPERRITDFLEKHSIKVCHLPLDRFSIFNVHRFARTVISIRRLIIKEKFNLLHCSGAWPSQYSLLAARLTKIPCIVHIHSTVYKKSEILHSLVSYADYIICASDAVKSLLKGYGCDYNKMKTVHYAVIDQSSNNNKFNSNSIRSSFNIPNDYKIVGQVSSIIPRKGLEYFIRAAAEIKRCFPNVKFVIVGEEPHGKNKYKQSLLELINDLKLETDIIFTGFKENPKELMSGFDISVLSSLNEALGIVIVESLWLEKAVVATSVGGIPEVVIHDKTGLLVPPHDSLELARAIRVLLENDTKRKNLAENGRNWVSENFSFSKHSKELFNIYTGLLKKESKHKIKL